MSRGLVGQILASYGDAGPVGRAWRAARLLLGGYAAIDQRLPRQGLIVDLGAGEGLLAQWLVRSAPARRVLAVDHDARRVARLERAARGLPVEARVGDLRAADLPRCDAILLVDVLHYLSRAEQEAVLVRAARALRPGGTLLLRDPDAGAGPRFAWNRLHEVLATRLGFTRGRVRGYRTARAWAVVLEAAGLADPRADDLAPWSPYADRVVSASVPAGPLPAPLPAVPWARLPAWVPAGEPRCAVCGGWRRRLALRHPEGDLAKCLACGLVSVATLPSADDAAAAYDAAYFRGDRGYRDYAAEEGHFRREFRRRLRRLRAAGVRGRVLDAGAATGAFLREARAAGFDGVGVEPCDAVAAAARASGLDVRTGTVEAVEFPAASFDLATAWDVIEHLRDPVAALRRLRGFVRPGGWLAVTVPDAGGSWARATGASWPFVTPREHLHYFTRRTLVRALRTAGWRPATVGLAGTPLSLGTLLRRSAGRLGAAADRVLGGLAHRGRALPFGTLFALARRTGD